MNEEQPLTGKVVSGVQKGAFFTQLDWVQEQCHEKLGFKPYPGTLNVEITDKDLAVLEKLGQKNNIELVPPDSNFCSGFVHPISLSGISGGIVLPAEDVRVHGKNIIEIIAPVRLKDALNIQDGDEVTLSSDRFDKAKTEDP